jgi:hypothetical protein
MRDREFSCNIFAGSARREFLAFPRPASQLCTCHRLWRLIRLSWRKPAHACVPSRFAVISGICKEGTVSAELMDVAMRSPIFPFESTGARIAAGVALVALVAGAVACGSASLATMSDNGAGGDGTTSPGAFNGADSGTSDNSPTAGQDGANDPSVSGIIAVHASRNLPAFRLCFPQYADRLPLPDDKVMPNANVVGVDIGSAVHIGSFATTPLGSDTSLDGGAAGEGGAEGGQDAGATGPSGNTADAGDPTSIYVIEEKLTRQFYPQGQDASSYPDCAQLVSVLKANGYDGHGLYSISSVNAVDTGIFATGAGVNLLVIEGCLPDPSLTPADCGDSFTTTAGNLRYRIVPSLPVPLTSEDAGSNVLNFQAMLLSQRVKSSIDTMQTVTFSFGQLDSVADGGLPGQQVGSLTGLGTLAPAMPVATYFPASSPSDYDNYGFVLQYGQNTLAQSLAQIQAQSSPRDLPQDFYLLPSNFVVLIVGDPTVQATAAGPGASLHLLAVPVRDPDTLANADGGQ